MKYFKFNDAVFAFEEDGSQDHLVTDEFVAMTDEEVSAHINQPPSVPQSIVALQGLKAIDHFGLASQYDAWANDQSRTFLQRAFINKAQTWTRDDVTLNAAADSFGLTSEQVDSMFILAATL